MPPFLSEWKDGMVFFTCKFYFKEIKDLKNCKEHLKNELKAPLILKFCQIEKSLPVCPAHHVHSHFTMAPSVWNPLPGACL